MSPQPKDTPKSVSEEEGNVRKRVCKACDRCRLKKSKCDGAEPCNRCVSDDTLCVFGERRRSHDKVYPKGYVEILEQQQEKMIKCMHDMYTRLENKEGWPGTPLPRTDKGYPLTHHILDRLGLLRLPTDSQDYVFEENPDVVLAQLNPKPEESSYPTPNTVKVELSPSESPFLANFPPTPFANETGMQYRQPPPPSQTPEQQDPTLPFPSPGLQTYGPIYQNPNQPSFPPPPLSRQHYGMNTTLATDGSTQFAWAQHPIPYSNSGSYYPYEVAPTYSGLGLTLEEEQLCLPSFDENISYTSFGEFPP